MIGWRNPLQRAPDGRLPRYTYAEKGMKDRTKRTALLTANGVRLGASYGKLDSGLPSPPERVRPVVPSHGRDSWERFGNDWCQTDTDRHRPTQIGKGE